MRETTAASDLAARLRDSGARSTARLRALPEAAFDGGRYENGWTAREILAHVAAIEWTYPRLLDIAREAPDAGGSATPAPKPDAGVRRTDVSDAADTPTRAVRGGIDDYNARQVAKRAAASVAELIAEFEKNRAATVAAVEAVDPSLLSAPIRSSGGITGVLGDVLNAVAVQHVEGHVDDIAAGA
ncbi:MAG: DinB family protein [Chloroflexi bacterium]|nr:DinB family protein [Chloroflexota bacterium]